MASLVTLGLLLVAGNCLQVNSSKNFITSVSIGRYHWSVKFYVLPSSCWCYPESGKKRLARQASQAIASRGLCYF